MDRKELSTFITVAKEGSFLKASRALFITPASVMNQMNKLEDNIGAKLIERTSQGTRLTPAGEGFLEDAQEILEHMEKAAERARQTSGAEKKVIRIGTSLLRPCRVLVDICASIDEATLPVTMRIIPFGDSPADMQSMLEMMGSRIDCFVGPCDSISWAQRYNILELGRSRCCVGVPRTHHLSGRDHLNWEDLNGETLMLVQRGDSPVLNALRDQIESNYSGIRIENVAHFYDTDVFNECSQKGYLMETLDMWTDVHPAIVTIPMDWSYAVPFGIVYSRDASEAVREFAHIVEQTARSFPSRAGGGSESPCAEEKP